MPTYRYKNLQPTIARSCFLAPDCQVIGNVELGEDVNIWFGTVIRGDVNKITIGANTNVQDLCMLHIDEENPLIIGKNVTIGHKVTLHGCKIEDSCLIGMGAIILDGVKVGKNSLVAAGSLLPPGKEYPPFSLIMGSPAKFVRKLETDEEFKIGNHYKSYVGYKNEYLKDFSKLT